MCLNGTYPFRQQPLSGNGHIICFVKPVLWTATCQGGFLYFTPQGSTDTAPAERRSGVLRRSGPCCVRICGGCRRRPFRRPECDKYSFSLTPPLNCLIPIRNCRLHKFIILCLYTFYCCLKLAYCLYCLSVFLHICIKLVFVL